MKPFTKLCLLIVLMLLNACASQAPQNQLPSLEQQQENLSLLSKWAIEGKIAFRGPNKSNSGYLKWQQKNNIYSIRIHGPLGQGNTEIEGSDFHITLTLPDQILQSQHPQELLYQQTGWQLPIKQLRYWVIGKADPSLPIDKIEREVYLTELEQNGWHISYSKYQLHSFLWLPGKITISKGDYTVIILAKQWKYTAQ